jgi:hypothetical protein
MDSILTEHCHLPGGFRINPIAKNETANFASDLHWQISRIKPRDPLNARLTSAYPLPGFLCRQSKRSNCSKSSDDHASRMSLTAYWSATLRAKACITW